MEGERQVNGTLVWYYMICKREVWLMAHCITADQEDDNMAIGRFIHEHRYQRDKKEISIGDGKVDFIRQGKNGMVVSEVKKSSRFLDSARMQLLYYLQEFKNAGVAAAGEIRIPEEKKVISIVLDEGGEMEIAEVVAGIEAILSENCPPPTQMCKYCKNCAYGELCWS